MVLIFKLFTLTFITTSLQFEGDACINSKSVWLILSFSILMSWKLRSETKGNLNVLDLISDWNSPFNKKMVKWNVFCAYSYLKKLLHINTGFLCIIMKI